MTTAIVLSGGGTKGAFEVGAVRCLYERGIRPDILCGTSIGAINALKLAEGKAGDDPDQGLDGLTRIWASLQEARDMYVEQDWLYHDKLHAGVRRALTGKSGLNVDGPGGFPGSGAVGSFGEIPIPGFDTVFSFAEGVLNAIPGLAWLVSEGKDLLESLQVLASEADALYNLHPVWLKLAKNIDMAAVHKWTAAGGRLRMAHVGLRSGELRWVTESGAVLERDGRTPVTKTVIPDTCSAFKKHLDKLIDTEQSLHDSIIGGADAVKAKRLLLDNIAAQTKASAQLRECLAKAAKQPDSRVVPAVVSLPAAALASASIPVMFPPTKLSEELAVDGGVREGLPLQMAVELGADVIYVLRITGRVGTSGLFHPRLADVAARSVALLLDEVNRGDTVATRRRQPFGEVLEAQEQGMAMADGKAVTENSTPTKTPRARPADLHVPEGVTAVMIEPDDLLYGTKVVDPGLIRINMDYGYMRTADVLDGVDASSRRWATSTEIALQRRDTWALENRRHGQPDPRIGAQVDTSPEAHRIPAPLDAALAIGVVGFGAIPLTSDLRNRLSGPDGWQALRELAKMTGHLDDALAYPVPPEPDPGLEDDLMQQKNRLAALIVERRELGGPMPDDIERWTDLMELHPWMPPPVGVATGNVTLLRLHRECGFGPTHDHIPVHVVTRLDSEPEMFLGFPLTGEGSDPPVHEGWLELLRSAFTRGDRVCIEYKREGMRNQLIRNVERLS